jgi:hypothetical protein
MAETKRHECDENCEHEPEFKRQAPLDEGDKAEKKHVESGLTPLIPTGT